MTGEMIAALCFPNRIDAAQVSGGAWVSALPLANLQSRALSQVARSSDLTPETCTIRIDLRKRVTIGCLALINHNLTIGGRYRITASDREDLSSPTFVKTYTLWEDLAFGGWNINALAWQNANFWLGSIAPEGAEGQTQVTGKFFANGITARYFEIVIYDRANPDGFIDLGRIFIGDTFLRPRINADWGATLGFEDPSLIDVALSGAEFFDRREPVRVARFSLANLSYEEGYARALDLTRRAGLTQEVFYFANPADLAYGARRNFLGRLRQLSPLEQASFQRNSMTFEIKELR